MILVLMNTLVCTTDFRFQRAIEYDSFSTVILQIIAPK